MKEWLSKNGHDWAFFALCVAVASWQCYYVALDTQLGGVGTLLQHWHAVAISIANALLLLSPYWLLPRRWRRLIWIPLTLLSIWSLAQVCYCRAYDDLMPWHSLTLTGNVNSTLAASTMALLRWHDLLIVLPYLCLMGYSILSRKGSSSGNGVQVRPWVMTLCAAMVMSAIGYLDGDTNYARRFLHNFANRSYFAQNGLLPYIVFTLHDEFTTPTITDSDREMAQHFVEEKFHPTHTGNAGYHPRHWHPNLVLVIVESLHTWPIGMRVDGREVTPVLNKLVDGTPGVIYAPHVLFQTSHGHSSDAHFIYNTGLLPLRDGAVAVRHGDGPYPTLAAALGDEYDCREVICTPTVNWNQEVTASTYGFTKLYSREELSSDLAANSMIDDAALMSFASRLVPEMREPFFLELVTMTMHAPYPRGKVPDSWITASTVLNAEARGYLDCVHVTDSCLGVLIDALRPMGLDDGKTVLAIVSDHTQVYLNRVENRPDAMANPHDWGIPLIIAGTDTTLRHDGVIGQVDVFPTLADVMGISPTSYPWRGLGYSILNVPRLNSAVQPRNMSILGDTTATDVTAHQLQAWDVSRVLILDRKHFADLWQWWGH